MRLPSLLCVVLALGVCDAAPQRLPLFPVEAANAIAGAVQPKPDTSAANAIAGAVAKAGPNPSVANTALTPNPTKAGTAVTVKSTAPNTATTTSTAVPDPATNRSATHSAAAPSPSASKNDEDDPTPASFGAGPALARGNSTGAMTAHDKDTRALLSRINAWRQYYRVPGLRWSEEIAWATWDQSNRCEYTKSHEHSQWAYPDFQGTIGDANTRPEEYDLTTLIDYFTKQPWDASQPQLATENNAQAVPFAILMWRRATAVGCSWVKCDWGINALLLTCTVDTGGTFTMHGDNQLYWDNIPLRPYKLVEAA